MPVRLPPHLDPLNSGIVARKALSSRVNLEHPLMRQVSAFIVPDSHGIFELITGTKATKTAASNGTTGGSISNIIQRDGLGKRGLNGLGGNNRGYYYAFSDTRIKNAGNPQGKDFTVFGRIFLTPERRNYTSCIISEHRNSTDDRWYVYLSLSRVLSASIGPSTGMVSAGSSDLLNDNTWQNFVFIMRDGAAEFYVNGIDYSSFNVPGSFNTANTDLSVMGRSDGDMPLNSNFFFTGFCKGFAWPSRAALEFTKRPYAPYNQPILLDIGGGVSLPFSGVGGATTIVAALAGTVDTAFSVSVLRRAVVGLGAEADTAFDLAAARRAVVGQAFEADAAQTIFPRRRVLVGLAESVNTGLSVIGIRVVLVGTASVADQSFGVTARHRVSAGVGLETDTAFGVTAPRRVIAGLALEADQAFEVTSNLAAGVGLALETDTAFAAAVLRRVSVGLAAETEAALAVSLARRKPVGRGVEADFALTVDWSRAVRVAGAVETDTALPLQGVQIIAVAGALETDTALPVDGARLVPVGVGLEVDTAFDLVVLRRVIAGLAIEDDAAFAVTVIGGTPYVVPLRVAPSRLRVSGWVRPGLVSYKRPTH